MIYGISLLLLTLGLLIAIPALRKLLHMLKIRENSVTTRGNVVSRNSAMNTAGWLLGSVSASEFVNHERPLVTYESADGKELSVEVIPSNFLSRRKYTLGESVEVAYDRSEPWRAYVVREWKAAGRDFWIGTAMSIVAIVLWILGRAYNMPF